MSDIKTRILLPKGEAMEPCTLVCERELGIELPRCDGKKLSSTTEDYDVYWLKPKDICELVGKGLGDLGLVGTDIVLEYVDSSLAKTIDTKIPKGTKSMCRFSVLGLVGLGEQRIRSVLNSDQRGGSNTLELPTAYPRMLAGISAARDLPASPYMDVSISGSVEVYANLVGAPGVADLVDTGGTAAKNGLVEIQKLLDIYPELVTRRE